MFLCVYLAPRFSSQLPLGLPFSRPRSTNPIGISAVPHWESLFRKAMFLTELWKMGPDFCSSLHLHDTGFFWVFCLFGPSHSMFLPWISWNNMACSIPLWVHSGTLNQKATYIGICLWTLWTFPVWVWWLSDPKKTPSWVQLRSWDTIAGAEGAQLCRSLEGWRKDLQRSAKICLVVGTSRIFSIF